MAWARRNEDLQRELRQALRSSLYDTEREAISVTTLEQVFLFGFALLFYIFICIIVRRYYSLHSQIIIDCN